MASSKGFLTQHLSIALQDGDVDIIKVKEHEGYVILTIERHVPRSTAY